MSMHVPQILVVDDDAEIRKLLTRYMREQGLRVQLFKTVRNGGYQLAAKVSILDRQT